MGTDIHVAHVASTAHVAVAGVVHHHVVVVMVVVVVVGGVVHACWRGVGFDRCCCEGDGNEGGQQLITGTQLKDSIVL
jgi:hypothetical protein